MDGRDRWASRDKGTGRATRRAVALAAGAPAALAVACAGGAAPAGAPPARGPVTVRFTYRANYSPAFDEFAAAFTRQTPEVTVAPETFPGADYFTKLDVLFAGGSAADVMWVSSIEAYFDQQARGRWLALDSRLRRDKVDLKEWFPGAVEMLRVKGALYALPLWAHPSSVALYYNKDVLAAEGIAPPDGTWSFEQTLAAAQRVARQTGSPDADRYGYQPSVAFYNGLSQVVRAFGGAALSDDGKRAQFQTPPVTAAVRWLAELFTRHRVAPPAGTSLNPLWDGGRVGMRIALYGTRREAQVTRPWPISWGVQLGPRGAAGTGGAELQTDCVPVGAHSGVADAAWAFHRFLSGQQIGLELNRNNLLPGARPDVWNHPDLTRDETHRPFIAAMQTAPPIARPANARLLELQREVDAAAAPIWRGEVSVPDGLVELNRRAQTVLDQPPPGPG
jgi:ABC-type glycerol-3-phosphate transport system substrate-binding protein